MRSIPPVRHLLPAVALLLATLTAADGPRVPSISALMHKQYTVSRAPFKVIKTESEAPSPDWQKVQAAGKTFGTLAATLSKKTPNHGPDESWRRLIAQHLADAKSLDDAAQARDAVTLRAAHRRIADSCKTCHSAHRPRRGE